MILNLRLFNMKKTEKVTNFKSMCFYKNSAKLHYFYYEKISNYFLTKQHLPDNCTN